MQVVERWIESRTPRMLVGRGDDTPAVLYGTVDELQVSLTRATEAMEDAKRDEVAHLIPDGYELLDARREVIDRIRAFVFDYLVRTETELELSDTVAQVLARHRTCVDAALRSFAPSVRDQLQAALRTARDDDKEARSQVLTTFRRVLVAVADHLYPPRDEPAIDSTGRKRLVGPGQYRNRLLMACEGSLTVDQALTSAMADLASRLDKLDDLTHKGVHDEVSRAEMEFGLVQTYCLVGELIGRQQG